MEEGFIFIFVLSFENQTTQQFIRIQIMIHLQMLWHYQKKFNSNLLLTDVFVELKSYARAHPQFIVFTFSTQREYFLVWKCGVLNEG